MKKVTFFLSSIIFLACNQPKNDVANNKETANKPIEIVNKLFEKFNSHDWKGMAALYADTADFKDPSFGNGIVKQTHTQIINKYLELSKIMPDVKDSIVAIYPSGNNVVVVEFISKATLPDGKKMELPITSILTINAGGFIEKDFTYYDNFGN
jgi:ketosteroid isomerase-like protein